MSVYVNESVVTIKVDIQTGTSIETAALQCVGIARITGANVEFQFGDMIVLVRPRDEANDVVRRCQKRQANQTQPAPKQFQCMFCMGHFPVSKKGSYTYDPDSLGICWACRAKQSTARIRNFDD